MAVKRKLAISTVYNHLTTCVKYGLPLHLSVLGVNDAVRKQVMDAVKRNDYGFELILFI